MPGPMRSSRRRRCRRSVTPARTSESVSDIRELGVYLTTAVKCGKTGYGVATETVKTCSSLLEVELALFPLARALMLMGDVAIKAVNAIARRNGEPRVVPAGATYKLRGGDYVVPGDEGLPVVRAGRPELLHREAQAGDDRRGHRRRARVRARRRLLTAGPRQLLRGADLVPRQPVVGEDLPGCDRADERVRLGLAVVVEPERARRTLDDSDAGQPPPKRFEPHVEQNVFADPSGGV